MNTQGTPETPEEKEIRVAKMRAVHAMTADEHARYVYERNKAKMERVAAKKEAISTSSVASLSEPVEVKEKPNTKNTNGRDGFIDVTVTVPGMSFNFRLIKPDILNNVPPRSLRADEFRKAIVAGLSPLIGAVK